MFDQLYLIRCYIKIIKNVSKKLQLIRCFVMDLQPQILLQRLQWLFRFCLQECNCRNVVKNLDQQLLQANRANTGQISGTHIYFKPIYFNMFVLVLNTIVEQICNYYGQIKLTQVSNCWFHVYTIFRLTFYKILISSIYLFSEWKKLAYCKLYLHIYISGFPLLEGMGGVPPPPVKNLQIPPTLHLEKSPQQSPPHQKSIPPPPLNKDFQVIT